MIPSQAQADLPPSRVAAVDALRALALVAMIAYHFVFDLRYFGAIDADFEHDRLWLTLRALILSSFLLLAGVSLVLADRARASRARFWRHVAMIAACALLVSAGSYAMLPRSYIWFGVLHAIALTLVLARPLAPYPFAALVLGIAIIAAGVTLAHPAFDHRTLGWLGFMTAKPRTEDYVPLFPWAGVVLVGIAAGHALMRSNFALLRPLARMPRWFLVPGRHTLFVYMVHQPLLLGFLWLAFRR